MTAHQHRIFPKRWVRRPPLQIQLTSCTAAYSSLLVAGVLAISGLLVRQGSTNIDGGTSSHNALFGHQVNAAPVIVAIAAALIALVLAWWVAGRFLRPLRTMNTAAREISATNLHRRLALDGPQDELTELGQTLDDLFARLEAAFEAQSATSWPTPPTNYARPSPGCKPSSKSRSQTPKPTPPPYARHAKKPSTSANTSTTSSRPSSHSPPANEVSNVGTVRSGHRHRHRSNRPQAADRKPKPSHRRNTGLRTHNRRPPTRRSPRGQPHRQRHPPQQPRRTHRGLHHVRPRTSVHHRHQHRPNDPGRRNRPTLPIIPASRKPANRTTPRERSRPRHRPSHRQRPPRSHHRTAPSRRRTPDQRHIRFPEQVAPTPARRILQTRHEHR